MISANSFLQQIGDNWLKYMDKSVNRGELSQILRLTEISVPC